LLMLVVLLLRRTTSTWARTCSAGESCISKYPLQAKADSPPYHTHHGAWCILIARTRSISSIAATSTDKFDM
jgi:hypothetical protein